MCCCWLGLNHPQTQPTSPKTSPLSFRTCKLSLQTSKWFKTNNIKSPASCQSMSINQSKGRSIIQSTNECGTHVRLITEKPINSLHCKHNDSCGCTENNWLGCRETNCFHFKLNNSLHRTERKLVVPMRWEKTWHGNHEQISSHLVTWILECCLIPPIVISSHNS